jgi:hypothetical protein
VRGVVKLVRLPSGVRAARWKTSAEAERVPVGREEEAKKAAGSKRVAWKVVVAEVPIAKSGGMERVRVAKVTVEVDSVEASTVVEATIVALPVQPLVWRE